MNAKTTYWGSLLVLIITPCLLMAWKWQPETISSLLPETIYQVRYHFLLGPSEKPFVKTYVPISNAHQEIGAEIWQASTANLVVKESNKGKRIVLRLDPTRDSTIIQYQFEYKGKALKYNLAENLPIEENSSKIAPVYLDSTEWIQRGHPEIRGLLDKLTYEEGNLKSTVEAIYRYTHNLPTLKTSQLTDALMAHRQQAASCNGKSRLFVALCRTAGIPARTVGGIILENTEKRTSHLWAEIYAQGQWIPFDPLNGHNAFLPAHYLQLYWGDHFLVTRTPGIDFDYRYEIKKRMRIKDQVKEKSSLWSVFEGLDIPPSGLKPLLLLPFCALLVGLLKNVIGLKTFGVFLPAIMAVTLVNTGFLFGLLSFVSVVLIVSLLHYPLEKWGILYAPKLVIMLTIVVAVMLCLAFLGVKTQQSQLASVIMFPIIIMTILAERFAKKIMEDSWEESVKMMLRTLLVCFFSYQIIKTDFLVGLILYFPEIYAFVIAVLLLLGKWIGLRLSEYRRFRWIAD